jgi:hypothetical protein
MIVANGCLSERKTLSQLLPNKHVSSFRHRSFWVSSLIGPTNFLHQCANMTLVPNGRKIVNSRHTWTMKGIKSPPLLSLTPLSLVDML